MSEAKHTQEVLRTGFDCDGVALELLFDEGKNRFSVATRYAYLTHFQIAFPSERCKRLAHDRASAAFESVCFAGATKEAAVAAKKAALSVFPSHCINAAGFEREVIRRAAKATGSTSCE